MLAGLLPAQHGQQQLASQQLYSVQDLNEQWMQLLEDANWLQLFRKAGELGFRKGSEKASWGFKGVLTDGKLRSEVRFCIYDFAGMGRSASLIWCRSAEKSFYLLLVLPQREGEMLAVMANTQEWQVKGGRLEGVSQLWARCLTGHINSRCGAGNTCSQMLRSCNKQLEEGMAHWFRCAGVLCGGCLAAAAITCLY
jgi:hypothetical protein